MRRLKLAYRDDDRTPVIFCIKEITNAGAARLTGQDRSPYVFVVIDKIADVDQFWSPRK